MSEKKISCFFSLVYDLEETVRLLMYKYALLFILQLCPYTLPAATFHAAIAIDTKTKDLKKTGELDLAKMRKIIHTIAKEAGMDLKKKIFKGSDLRLKHFAKWLSKAKIEKDDCVFFYFSGHGFGDKAKRTPWPIMCFKKGQDYISVEALRRALESKKPRFFLILCDACNNYVKLPKVIHSTLIPKSAMELPDGRGLKKLFKHAKGKIIASGAIPGTTSWASDDGGIYTLAFLKALQKESTRSDPSWKHLFKRIPYYMSNTQQIPQFWLQLE